MAQKIQLRRGTAAQWTSANPILADGEVGTETDTSKLKIGNGSTTWASLAYAAGSGGGGAANTDALPEGTTNLYSTAARVRSAILTGLTTASALAVGAADSVLVAFGKLQAQVDALLALIAGKADSGHSHTGFTPAGGTTGQVLKKNSNTSYDFGWLTDAGATQNSMTPASASLAPTVDAVVAALATKADLLAPVFETATTGSLTKAGHTNREVTITNAAACSRAFNLAGMVAGDSGVIFQGGAGVITLTGPNFVFAPGVTASATTAGPQGALAWRFVGGTTVAVFSRSEVVSGGGGGASNVQSYRQIGNVTVPLDAGLSGALMTLDVGPLVADGDMVTTYLRFEADIHASEEFFTQLSVNDEFAYGGSVPNNARATYSYCVIERINNTTARVTPNYQDEFNTASSVGFNDITVTSLAAGCVIRLRTSRPAIQVRAASIRRLSAVVTRA